MRGFEITPTRKSLRGFKELQCIGKNEYLFNFRQTLCKNRRWWSVRKRDADTSILGGEFTLFKREVTIYVLLFHVVTQMNASFSSLLPPLIPTNRPSTERINQLALNDNCMIEMLVFSPEDSK